MSRLKVITLCCGYDAQCLALQRLGIDFDLWWSEIDKYAIQAHNILRLCAGGALKHGSFNPPLNLVKKRKYEYSR